MFDYMKPLAKRVNKGNYPLAYDLYNEKDVDRIMPTIPASYGCWGRVGTTLIFEEERNEREANDQIPVFPRHR